MKRTIQSVNRHVAAQMVRVSLLILIGKIAGAGREMSLAFRFGIGPIIDAYVLIYVITTWLPSLFASIMISLIVPLRGSVEVSDWRRFNSELSGVLLLLGVLFSVLMYVFLPRLLLVLDSGELSPGIDEIEWLVIGMVPSMTAGLLVCQYNALLISHDRHIGALLDGVPSLVMLTVLLLWTSTSVFPLTIGAASGVLLHTLVLIFVLRANLQVELPKISLTSSVWGEFGAGFKVMLIGQIVISIVPIVDQSLAALLGGYSNSVLSYSSKLLALFMALGATAIGRALLPALSRIESFEIRLNIVFRWFRVLFLLGVLMVLLGWIATPFLVSLIYERGAFTSTDVQSVSIAVRFGLLQVPFYFSGIVLVQLFASDRRYSILMVASCIALLVKSLTGMFLPRMYGVPGIMLTSTAMYVATSVFLVFSARSSEKTRVPGPSRV